MMISDTNRKFSVLTENYYLQFCDSFRLAYFFIFLLHLVFEICVIFFRKKRGGICRTFYSQKCQSQKGVINVLKSRSEVPRRIEVRRKVVVFSSAQNRSGSITLLKDLSVQFLLSLSMEIPRPLDSLS